jgi:hypothetical protein
MLKYQTLLTDINVTAAAMQTELCMYAIQHCFICRPSDSTVSDDAGIEPRTVAPTALTVRRSHHSARCHPTRLNLNYSIRSSSVTVYYTV